MLVFDATSLVALFRAHPVVYTLWERADEGLVKLGFPALAVVEAGTVLKTHASAWDVFLLPETVTVLPLMERAAVEIADWPGTYAVRQTLWEALHMDCPIVTRDEGLYPLDEVMVLQV